MKATFVLSFFALAAQVVFATPPACLLQAVNTQDNPADMNAVCGDSATKVQSAIASMCGSDTRATAQSAFIATCSAAGKKVAAYTASSSSSPSGSSSTRSGTYLYTTAVYNSSCSCTQTIVTSVAAAQATGASSSRTSGAAVSTAGAVHGSQQKMGGYAAAAIALVGAVAAL